MRGVHMEATPNRLRELRIAHGLKLYEVAGIVGRDQSTVYRYERGLTPIPDDAKRALMQHYGVTAEHLMRWDSEQAA